MVINAQYCFSGINSFALVAIPLFMLAGIIMSKGGIARRIVDYCDALIGFVTGGLGAVAILASMFFGALSGSGMATTSAIGGMMIPEMIEKNYSRAYASTLVCFGGIVGPIIPPSSSFVMYGTVANVSISDLFIAGLLPGILIGLCLILTNYIICRKNHFGVKDVTYVDLPAGVYLRQRGKLVLKTFAEGFWAFLSPEIILCGIYSGVFSPTEAAAISVLYSILISFFVYRTITLKDLYKAFAEAVVLNGITSFLLGYSTVFSAYLAYAKIPAMVNEFLQSVSDSRIVVLLLINIFLLVLGCFLDTIPAITIMAPILLPTAVALGIDPIHFGVIMAVNLAIGLCTPPYGCNLFVGCAVGRVKMEAMMRYIIPLLAAVIIALMIITFVPSISMFLVK